jgi:hypothetical protein
MSARKRAVSRIVPDPITRSCGTPASRAASAAACAVSRSTGFVATSSSPSGLWRTTAGTSSSNTAALRSSRSSRVSPSRCAAPAVITVTVAPAHSS